MRRLNGHCIAHGYEIYEYENEAAIMLYGVLG